MFRRNPELGTPSKLKAKSLDDLSSTISAYLPTATSLVNHSILSSFVHTALHPLSHFSQVTRQPLPSLDTKERCGSPSSDQGSYNEPVSPLPLPSFSLDSSCDTLEVTRETEYGESILSTTAEGFPQSTFNFASTTLEEAKESGPPWDKIVVSTPAGPQLEVHSPITQAMIRASIPQKVIMTPRSRCPIIVNSTTSLSSVIIPEEKNSHSPISLDQKREQIGTGGENLHTSPVIVNSTAQLTSPLRPIQPLADSTNLGIVTPELGKRYSNSELESENNESKNHRTSFGCKKTSRENKLSRWSSSSLRRTLSSASSGTSLFGGFFRHLSTSSLAQLATRLTSSSSLQDPEEEEEENGEKESSDEFLIEEDEVMNESLSSVFKDYLLSRSILTDNPIDLSTNCLDNEDFEVSEMENGNSLSGVNPEGQEEGEENLGDSAYGDSQPPSKCTSRQCSKASLGSLDSALDLYPNTDLSQSLLYCLDGNNPLSPSSETDCVNCQTRIHNDSVTHTHNSFFQKKDETEAEHLLGLHSCSPDSRRESLLKTKQGTPVPHREKKSPDSVSSAKGVLFETSF
ncbi:uncharacterized protein LOC121863683 [Homarus americanus]|uniref:uncharacterized protein LOC121863683 n=1 Tax=Homarus americanus TaxID=6706 RepID=UPI001C44C1E7|nr:uncharacterized protein LOC121863683 [Homarus americanus]